MPVKIQAIRSSLKGQRPASGSREPGELYVNWADKQFGTMDAGKVPLDLVAVRFFSTATDYLIGDYVVEAGVLYRAIAFAGAGTFNPSKWVAASELPEAPNDGKTYGRKNLAWSEVVASSGGGTAASIVFTPAGNISATDVQAALVELDTEKVAKAGDTMSGNLTVNGAAGIVSTSGIFTGNGPYAILAANSSTVYLRPNGGGSALNNATLDVNGKLVLTGTGTLTVPGGSAAATSINFGTAGTGFYGTALLVKAAVSGVDILSLSPTLGVFSVPLQLPTGGSVSATSLNFGTAGTGMFGGSTSLSFAVGGARKLLIGTTLVADVALSLPADPVNPLEAATKQYVDGKAVAGPATSVDNAIVRFDGTTGKLIQGSATGIDDSGNIYGTNFVSSGQILDGPPSGTDAVLKLTGTGAAKSWLYMIAGQSGQANGIRGQMGATALDRWIEYLGNGDAESGSNAGSNYALYRCNDAGAAIDVPLAINRANGQVTLANQLNVGNSIVVSGAGNVMVPSGGNFYLNGTINWVRQGHLVTTTGGINVAATILVSTLPGGSYGFAPVVYSNVAEGHIGSPAALTNAATPGTIQNTGTTTISAQYFIIGRSATGTQWADQRYVTASAPYDMGDGDIPLFTYALVDKGTGKILGAYTAQDPPWAYNGPTDITPHDYRDGKGYRRVKDVKFDKKLSPRERAIALHEAPFVEIEITPAYKNSDMALLPHPWTGDPHVLDGTAIPVLLDPMSDLMPVLDTMREVQGPSAVLNLIHTDGEPNALVLGNTPLKRAGPRGLMIVSAKWR